LSDRVLLEMAEARVLVFSYYRNREVLGLALAGKWLGKRLKRLEKFYGKGVGERVRVYMRCISDRDYFP